MPDFPTTPVDGDTHVIATSTWKYYSSTDRWEIEDTSGVPQTVSTLLQTLTWSAGDNNIVSNPIVYSDYTTLIITYANVVSDASVTTFKMCKPAQVAGQLDCIHPRNYNSGEGVMNMNGTQTINTSSGTSSSVINLNGTEVTTTHSNVIGADYDRITFGWTAGAFAAGGSIEIRGISLRSPASGGAVEFISYSEVISNAATVDFTGFDDSKYVSYFFELNDVRHDQTGAVSPPSILYLSLATSGTTYDKTDGNYVYGGSIDSHGFKLVTGFSNQNMGATGQFRIYNPHVTAYTMGHNEVASSYQPGSGPSQPDNIYGGFIDNGNARQMYLNTGSITAAQFWVGNDDNTTNYSISNGEIRMYGLRKQ